MPDWKQYAGYVNITTSKGDESLFYWFVESQNNPETDPVRNNFKMTKNESDLK